MSKTTQDATADTFRTTGVLTYALRHIQDRNDILSRVPEYTLKFRRDNQQKLFSSL